MSADDDRLLWSRGREILHNGVPLDIVGLEEGDNDFRHRTPALGKSDQAVVMVDAEEQYLRRIAMYTESASFHMPLSGALETRPSYSEPAPSPALRRLPPGGSPEEASWIWPILLPSLLVVILGAGIWWYRRGRYGW